MEPSLVSGPEGAGEERIGADGWSGILFFKTETSDAGGEIAGTFFRAIGDRSPLRFMGCSIPGPFGEECWPAGGRISVFWGPDHQGPSHQIIIPAFRSNTAMSK